MGTMKKSKDYVEGFKAAINIVKYRLDFMKNMAPNAQRRNNLW